MKFSRIFTLAAVAGSLTLGVAAHADAISPEQKTQFEGIIHDYIMKNPEVLMQSVQGMQQKQMEMMRAKGEETALKNAGPLFHSSSDPVAGNAKGKVTLVEFFDYQCPHCVDMDPVLTGLIKANPDLRVVYKEFPIRGPVSMLATKAALAAQKQGKYNEMHEALMKSAKDLSETTIINIAKSIGLDVDKLQADIKSEDVEKQIKANAKLAQDIGIYGTPALFVAKTELPKGASASAIDFIPGQVDQAALQSSIDKTIK